MSDDLDLKKFEKQFVRFVIFEGENVRDEVCAVVSRNEINPNDCPAGTIAYKFFSRVEVHGEGWAASTDPYDESPHWFIGGEVFSKDRLLDELPVNLSFLLRMMREKKTDKLILLAATVDSEKKRELSLWMAVHPDDKFLPLPKKGT